MPPTIKRNKAKKKGKSAKVGERSIAWHAMQAATAPVRSIFRKQNSIIMLNIEAKIRAGSDLFPLINDLKQIYIMDKLNARPNINIGQFIFNTKHQFFNNIFDRVYTPEFKKIIMSNYVKNSNNISLEYEDMNIKNNSTGTGKEYRIMYKLEEIYEGDGFAKNIKAYNEIIANSLIKETIASNNYKLQDLKVKNETYRVYLLKDDTVNESNIIFGYKENIKPSIFLGYGNDSGILAPGLNTNIKKKLELNFDSDISYLLLYTERLLGSTKNISNRAYKKDKNNNSRKIKESEVIKIRIKPKEKISTQIRLPSANRVNTKIHQGLSIPVLGPNGYPLFGQGQGFGGQGQGFGLGGQGQGYGLGGQGQGQGFGGQTPGFGLGGQGQGRQLKNEFLQQSNYPDFQNIGGPILAGSKKKSNSRNKPRKQSKKKNKSKK